MADLAGDLRLPLLVVVDSKLGAINHTLLTLEAAAARGLAVSRVRAQPRRRRRTRQPPSNASVLARCTDVAQPGHDSVDAVRGSRIRGLPSSAAIDWKRLLPSDEDD